MADVKSKETRSYNMSRIRSKNTKPKELVRKYLFSKGFRYRKNDKSLLGTLDIVLPKYKTVIFINGCFWHGYEGCKYFIWLKNNAEFWHNKINTNKIRDEKKHQELRLLGWNVEVVWECQLKPAYHEDVLLQLEEILKARLQNLALCSPPVTDEPKELS